MLERVGALYSYQLPATNYQLLPTNDPLPTTTQAVIMDAGRVLEKPKPTFLPGEGAVRTMLAVAESDWPFSQGRIV